MNPSLMGLLRQGQSGQQPSGLLDQSQGIFPLVMAMQQWGPGTTFSQTPATMPTPSASQETTGTSVSTQQTTPSSTPTLGLGGYFSRPVEQAPQREWSLIEGGSPAVSGQSQPMWFDAASGQTTPYTPGGSAPNWFPYIPQQQTQGTGDGSAATPQKPQAPQAPISNIIDPLTGKPLGQGGYPLNLGMDLGGFSQLSKQFDLKSLFPWMT